MKKAILILAITFTGSFAFAQKEKEEKEKVSASDVPAAVKTSFTSTYPNAKVEK